MASLVIEPGSVLLTSAGETMQLEATVFDAAGEPVQATVSWQSSDPGVVSVSSGGLLTAAAGLGSAQITAVAQGVTSEPVLALVARPGAGAVLVPDSLILTDPVAVDPDADYGPGWRYRIRVREITVETGRLVIGTGGRSLAGRVVGATAQGAETELTVEFVALNQLFAELQIDETIPLVEMEAGTEGSSSRAFDEDFAARADSDPTGFTLGRFKCTASGGVPDLDLPSPTLNISPDLSLALGYANGLEKYAVVGTITADFGYKPVFKAAFEGKVGCETVLRTLTVPLGGVLAWFVGIQVPIGVGFTLDGKLEIAEVGFDVTAEAEATAELGLLCPTGGGTCTGLTIFGAERDFDFEFIAPDPTDQFKVELGAKGFLFARPSVGSRFSARTQFAFIEATAGLKQSVDLATTTRQVKETDYASGFKLEGRIDVGPGKDLQDAIDKLGDWLGTDLNIDLPPVAIADTLDESPKGTFTITPARVTPGNDEDVGEMATFTVELDPVKYRGLESVEKVEIYWKQEGESAEVFTLEPGRPGCTDISGGPGQTKFECETGFLEEHAGEQTFYAFIHAKLFGVTLPIPIEVADDGLARVTVGVENPVEILENRFAAFATAASGSSDTDAEEETDFTDFSWSGSAQSSWAFSSASATGSFEVGASMLPDGIRVTAAGSGSGTGSGSTSFGDARVGGTVSLRFKVVAPLVQLTLSGERLGKEEGCTGDRDCDSGFIQLRDANVPIINVPGSTPPGAFEYTLSLTPGEYLFISDQVMRVSATGELDGNGAVQTQTRSQNAEHSFTLTVVVDEEEP